MHPMISAGKTLLLSTITLGIASAAMAEPRYNPRRMSCDAVQGVIADQGAVTLRYTSSKVRNLPLYNRYVVNSRFCDRQDYAQPATVPTTDNPKCRVLVCAPRYSDDEDNPMILFPFGREQ